MSFDRYMIEKMFSDEKNIWNQGDVITDEMRQEAYRRCMIRMGEKKPAALQTMQKWFGIHGHSAPNREMVFRIGFTLGFSKEEMSDMLRRGILEPDFQVNDYREVIFMYGYANQMSYEMCMDLIERYERELPLDFEVQHHNHTNDILEAEEEICKLGQEEFFTWMVDHAEEFKGYSMTVLQYFQLFKQEILKEVCQEARERLDEYLIESGYYIWEKGRKANPKNRKSHILKFVEKELKAKGGEENTTLAENILEMREIAYFTEDSNVALLAEMYASLHKKKKARMLLKEEKGIYLLDDKRISELLNIGIHKEKEIHYSILYQHLKEERKNKEIRRWLEEERKKVGRRLCIMGRQDLLPLILCVAQKRYWKKMDCEGVYNAQEARQEFVELANRTLRACRLEPLCPEKYEMDAIVYQCYKEEEMHALSDVLEDMLEDRGMVSE